MPSATITSLTADEIDDLLYFARTGQLDDFRACIDAVARSLNTAHYEVVGAAIELRSGNSPLHMAGANGHASELKSPNVPDYFFPNGLKCASDVLNYLLATVRSAPRERRASTLNVQNVSGNTPLHWASLNGHLEAVKILMAAGADPSVTNLAGHDAVYEAEINRKDAVVEWLLTEGNGLESGHAVNDDSNAADDQVDEKADDDEIDQDMEKLTVG